MGKIRKNTKMGKVGLLIAALLSVACDPIGDARDECEEVFEQKYQEVKDDIWNQCTSYYEEYVIPEIEGQIDQLMVDLENWFAVAIKSLETDYMTRLGCIPNSSALGWDCSTAEICLP